MKEVYVSETCVGCLYCHDRYPEIFGFEPFRAFITKEKLTEKDLENIEFVSKRCPKDSIKIKN